VFWVGRRAAKGSRAALPTVSVSLPGRSVGAVPYTLSSLVGRCRRVSRLAPFSPAGGVLVGPARTVALAPGQPQHPVKGLGSTRPGRRSGLARHRSDKPGRPAQAQPARVQPRPEATTPGRAGRPLEFHSGLALAYRDVLPVQDARALCQACDFPATHAHFTFVDATIVCDPSLRRSASACVLFQPCYLRALLTPLPTQLGQLFPLALIPAGCRSQRCSIWHSWSGPAGRPTHSHSTCARRVGTCPRRAACPACTP
jgi:hypothetical protein